MKSQPLIKVKLLKKRLSCFQTLDVAFIMPINIKMPTNVLLPRWLISSCSVLEIAGGFRALETIWGSTCDCSSYRIYARVSFKRLCWPKEFRCTCKFWSEFLIISILYFVYVSSEVSAKLCIRADSSEPSLLTDAISTKISLLHICFQFLTATHHAHDYQLFWPWGYKTWVQSQTQNKAQWLAACGHMSASSQS